jgi:phage shock protein A
MSLFAMSFFGFVGAAVLVLLAVGVVVWLVNRRAGKDLLSAGRAQVGKLGQAAKNADPKAMLEQQVRDANDALNSSVSDLEESKGMVTELDLQVQANQREVNTLDARVKASLSVDPDDKSGKAGEYVQKLTVAKGVLTTNQEQLKKVQAIYANNLAKFRLAQGKVKAAGERAKQLGVELKQSETNAKIAKVAAKFNVNVEGLDDSVAEAEAAMRSQIARNNAVGEVQTDLGLDGVKEAEEEDRLHKAEAKVALEEYRKQMGLTPKN